MTHSSSQSQFILISSGLYLIPIIAVLISIRMMVFFQDSCPLKLLFEPIFVILTSFLIFKFKYSCFIQVLSLQKICLPMTNSVPQPLEGKPHPKLGPCHYCVKTNSQLFTVRKREHYKGRSSMEQKEQLIQLVTTENYRIKEAAKVVRLTYSTAKKIFIKFRKTLKTAHQAKMNLKLSTKRSSYVQILPSECQIGAKMEVISTIAGKEQQKACLLQEDFEDSECDC